MECCGPPEAGDPGAGALLVRMDFHVDFWNVGRVLLTWEERLINGPQHKEERRSLLTLFHAAVAVDDLANSQNMYSCRSGLAWEHIEGGDVYLRLTVLS